MANGDRNHVTVDIEAMLGQARPLFATECCIYKVPREIRQLNEDAYTPQLVSIGPFHHGNTKLLKMEGPKQVYCQRFIERSEASLDNLVSCVQELEPRFRRCYSENIELGVDELIKLILVDCGFVIELFLNTLHGATDDVILARPWLTAKIILDLFLLENQLPLFVLEELYKLAFASLLNGGRFPSFMGLALSFLTECDVPTEPLPLSASSTAHFTDLVRNFYLQLSDRLPPRTDEPAEMLNLLRYSASALNEAGVTFKKFTVDETNHRLLGLQFSGHILEIPEIHVFTSTEIWWKNMLALEKFHYPTKSYITDYIILLDLLINTEKDVDVLVKHGIIVNRLGDNNAVAQLFNSLTQQTVVSHFNIHHLRICKELNAYYEHPWHTTKATLRRDYCSTPWTTVASIAGIALLILTVIQTVCSIFPVVK